MNHLWVCTYFSLTLTYPAISGKTKCPDVTDLVANWTLDGTDKDVILRNNASYKSEDGVTALYLDGKGSYADTPSTDLYQFSAFTIMCWVKVLVPAKNKGYIYADWSRPYQFSFWVNGIHKSLLFHLRNELGRDILVMHRRGIRLGVWMHLAVTWDQQRQVAEMFFNGSKRGEQSPLPGRSGYSIISSPSTYYQIGSKADTKETFHGLVRKMKVYKRLLNSSEIFQEARMFKEDAYHFNTWLIIKNTRLTLDLLIPTSAPYKEMKAKVMAKFNGMVRGFLGFFSAELQRFGPQSVDKIFNTTAVLMADINISCSSEQVKFQLMKKIKKDLASISLFNKTYIDFLDTANCKCLPANVDVNLSKVLGQVKVIHTTDVINFQADVQHSRCSSVAQSLSYWLITKAQLTDRTFYSFMRNAMKQSKPVWSTQRRVFIDRFYHVSYILRAKADLRIIGYDYGFIQVTRRDFVARISGVSSAEIGGGNIYLVGSLPYVRNSDLADSLIFTWFCRRSYEKLPKRVTIPLVDSPKGNANASGGCYGYGPGRLMGHKTAIVVQVDKMESGQTYVFELDVSDGASSSRDVHELTVIKKPHASFSISCIYNCGPEVIPTKRMIFESRCRGNLCEKVTGYDWSLYEKADPKSSWVQIADLAERILTDLDNPTLVLTGRMKKNEYSLKMNTAYKIAASIKIAGGYFRDDSMVFQTVAPLEVPKEKCNVQPKEGFVIKTLFFVNCSGWRIGNDNLTFKFSYNTSRSIVTAARPQNAPYISLKLPQGYQAKDYNVTLRVDITDVRESSYSDIVTVKVKPLPQNDSSMNVETLMNDLGSLLEETRFSEAATLAIAILSSHVEDRTKDSILKAMADIKIADVSQVTGLSTIVVMATQNRVQIPMDALEDAASLLSKATDFLRAYQGRDVIEDTSADILEGISNTLTASTSFAKKNYHEALHQEDGGKLNLTQTINRRRREAEQATREFYKAKQVTEKILSTADMLGTTLLSIQAQGQRKTTLQTDIITMTLQSKAPSKIGNETFYGNDGEGAVTFPPMKVLFGRKETNLRSVGTQMTTLQINPYVWNNRSNFIKSSVLSVNLKRQDGSLLEISDLSQPIELFIPERIQKNDETGNSSQRHFFLKRTYNGSSPLLYHKIEIENDFQAAFVEISPENNSSVDVFVSRGVKPSHENYKLKTRIPDFSSCVRHQDRTGYTDCTRNPNVLLLSSNITGGTGVHFIGIRLLNMTGIAQRQTRHISTSCKDKNGRQKRSCIGVKDPPTTPPPAPEIITPQYNPVTDVNYTMSVKIRSCLYWSEKIQAWTTKGCEVGWKITDGKLHCLCKHLSAFGGNIFVAPNPIDFEKVWKEFKRIADSGNFVVLSTVLFIFGVYLLGLVAARRADKKDSLKVVANVYITNSQTEGYTYFLSIQTGVWKGFGTSAHVGIIINGEEGSSGPITLTDPLAKRKYFARGSVNNFTLTLPFSLGKVTDICIWHDNIGSNPAWFLQQVVLTDQQTEQMWYFFVNQWLALDERSGSIELSVEAAKEDELAEFKHLFFSRTARSLGDGHIWISVFARPPHSPFTRCQRLTCCLAFLFTAMVTNAMFYQFGRIPTDSFRFGPLVMSWTQLKIGIQSSFIAIPANFLVILIYRNTKRKSSDEVYDPREVDKKPKPPGCLPPFFIYVAWTFSLIISLTGATFSVFYSLMWGADTSNKWLTSILVSLFQDVLLTQPIKVFTLAAFLSLLVRKPLEQDPVIGASLFQSKKGENFRTKRKRDKELAGEKEADSQKWSMMEAIKEVLSFSIFSFLLMVICYGDIHPTRFQFTKSTMDIFSGLDEVDSTSSLWNWVDEALIPGLYDVTWYNGRSFEYKEGFISNKKNFLIGMPRLRQLRSKPRISCPNDVYNTHITDVFPGCFQKYSPDTEDVTPYHLPKWIKLQNYSLFSSIDDLCPKPWRYQSGSMTQTLSHDGYGGGGYIADLGYNGQSASKVIKGLSENNWIDGQTVAVFIEFTLYDPATSLFCSGRLVYEASPSGKPSTKMDIRTLAVFPSPETHWQRFYEVCQLFFLIVIVIHLIAAVVKFFRQSRYFRQIWNWVEVILLVDCIVVVAMSFLKGKYTSLFVRKIKSNPYETYGSDYIVRWLNHGTTWLSIAIFIVTLKLLRLIRFNSHICQMQGTLKRSARSIFSFSLLFVIAVIAFSHFGFLGFGAHLEIFSSFFNSLRVVLQMSVGKQVDYVSIYLNNSLMGSLYLFLFLVVVMFFLINIFVAILVDAYEEVRGGKGDDFFDVEVGNFMCNTLRDRGKELPAHIRSTMKSLCKHLSKKCFIKSRSPDVELSSKEKRFIESSNQEAKNNIDMSPVSPTLGITDYPLRFITEEEVKIKFLCCIKNIIYEDDLLDEMKSQFLDMETELISVLCSDVTDSNTETRL